MPDVRGKILPVYFVPDESASMTPSMGEINKSLEMLHDTIHDHPQAAEIVRLSIVGFSDGTIEHLHLAQLLNIAEMPKLKARSSTCYAAAFSDLRKRIELDIEQLKSEGYLVHRPVVFFLSDGQPTDDSSTWREALRQLKSSEFKFRPNIIAFGFRDAVASIILEVASHQDYAFITAKGADSGIALAEFFQSLTQSLVESGQALAEGRTPPPFVKPDGYKFAYDLMGD
jgi:uncharacterized protein YegL